MSAPSKLPKELVIRGIKILDIGYLTVIYFVLAYFFAVVYDRVLGDFDESENAAKSTVQLSLELMFHIWTIGVLVYVVRNMVELIPFPLDGIYGYNHLRLKELIIAPVFTLVLITLQDHLRKKMNMLYRRFVDA